MIWEKRSRKCNFASTQSWIVVLYLFYVCRDKWLLKIVSQTVIGDRRTILRGYLVNSFVNESKETGWRQRLL